MLLCSEIKFVFSWRSPHSGTQDTVSQGAKSFIRETPKFPDLRCRWPQVKRRHRPLEPQLSIPLEYFHKTRCQEESGDYNSWVVKGTASRTEVWLHLHILHLYEQQNPPHHWWDVSPLFSMALSSHPLAYSILEGTCDQKAAPELSHTWDFKKENRGPFSGHQVLPWLTQPGSWLICSMNTNRVLLHGNQRRKELDSLRPEACASGGSGFWGGNMKPDLNGSKYHLSQSVRKTEKRICLFPIFFIRQWRGVERERNSLLFES